MQFTAFLNEIRKFELQYSVETQQREFSAWSSFLIVPVPGCIESCLGPISAANIQYIHIFVIQQQSRGVRHLSQFINQQHVLEEILQKYSIPYIQSQTYVLSIDLQKIEQLE